MLASAIPNRVSSESHECSHSNGRVAFEVDEIIVSRLDRRSKLKININVDFFNEKQLQELTYMFIFAPIKINDMDRNLLIELLEDGDKVSLYSPHFDHENKQNS